MELAFCGLASGVGFLDNRARAILAVALQVQLAFHTALGLKNPKKSDNFMSDLVRGDQMSGPLSFAESMAKVDGCDEQVARAGAGVMAAGI